ncbi:CLUMA_CG006475, isoform A [Clunio marinus]|uniref:ubiquitinyl hydrolase 1 n=1 Tax=Clunio marinus TaxID=568069 RepID=A0A1J1I0P6_9DIPT|nr:CLUMA_CG006475, isoform A [Clunio marinus]
MESDKVLMAMVTGAAVVGAVGAFVFWPGSKSKLRQRRGQISGLINFGNTCFLNTLLQAVASSPQFLTWLQLHDSLDKKSLISSLQMILDCINGTHPTIRSDPSNPAPVIRALNALGWVIPEGENDPHELLHVILTSVEEEALKPKKIGCLSDALGEANISAISQALPARPSSAMLTEFDKELYNESSNLMRLVRSEAQTPESNQSTVDENESIDHSMLDLDDDNRNPSLQDSPPSIISATTGRPTRSRNPSMSQSNGDAFSKRNCGSYRSLDRLSRGPGRVSVWSEKVTKNIPPPFRGSISSQLMCSGCNYKSVVRVDKFDSISLNLPEQKVQTLLSLGQLLGEYVAPETVNDVECESCNKIANHTKTLTFTKLPPCLAIHIVRTSWSNGQTTKRNDFVHFPESLSMAPYSFIQPSLGSNCSTPWGSTMSLYSASLANATPTNENVPFGSPFTSFGMFPRNLYRLLAVVVHGGDGANTGHFITYRRGSLRNYHKWYYTSDHFVKEVSIEEVLASPAYMLFYDRSQSRN